VDIRALKVEVFDGRGNSVETDFFDGFQRNQLFLDELNNFLDSMQGKQASVVDLREGVQSLRMALGAKESLVTGKIVEFEAPSQ
jgi:predicted dehydrogenase